MSRQLRVRLLGIAAFALAALAATALKPAPKPPAGFASIRSLAPFQAPALLEKAWALPVAATYPHPLQSQTNPSACGPTSVSNVLSSISAPKTPSEVASHGAGCVAGFCFGGLTLAQLRDAAALALPSGWSVTVIHPTSVEALRDELRHANDLKRRAVVNFHRFPLFGMGGGHHSPLGGYLEADDLVFVLDVNANFGPWLVPTARLFEAIDTVDASSGEKRGLLRFEAP